MDASQQEFVLRLAAFFDNDREMIKLYLQRYGCTLSLQNVQRIRDEVEGAQKASPQSPAQPVVTPKPAPQPAPANELSNDKSPLYSVTVECPVCHKNNIEFRDLRAKTLMIQSDPFTAPLYFPTEGIEPLDFNLYAVCVCPKCLFASPDRKDFRFTSPYTKQTTPSQLPATALRDLVDAMGERKTLVETHPGGTALFRPVRNVDSGVLAYQLALERVEVEKIHNIPLAHFKAGFYWIKLALLRRCYGGNEDEALLCAAKELEEAFRKTDFSAPQQEYHCLYTLGAIKLRLGDKKACRQYMSILDKVKAEVEQNVITDPAIRGSIFPWHEKAQLLWVRRDDEDVWFLPKDYPFKP